MDLSLVLGAPRTFDAARTAAVAATVLLGVLLSGCGVHLHRPSDAKQAGAVRDTFKDLKLDAALTTARANTAALTTADLETRQKFGETLLKHDLFIVIDPPPSDGEPAVPLGWRKLEADTADAVRRYGLADSPPAFTDEGKTAAQDILNRAENRELLVRERRRHESMVQTYHRGTRPAPRPTDCKDVPESAPPARADEDPLKFQYFVNNIVPGCKRIKAIEKRLESAETALRRYDEYKKVADEIVDLETRIVAAEARERELGSQYDAAKKNLADAETTLAKLTVTEQTKEAKDEFDKAKEKAASALTTLKSVLDEAKKHEVLDAALKNDLVGEVVANGAFLTGDDSQPAHRLTKDFAQLLEQYPEIAGRLRAADRPPVTAYILELALQRLKYRDVVVRRAADQELLTLLRGKRDVMIEAAVIWIRAATNLQGVTPDASNELRRRGPAAALGSLPAEAAKPARGTLQSYTAAKLIEDIDVAAFDGRIADRYRRLSLDLSEVALEARRDLIRAPLVEIAAYHEGGIRPEEIAMLLHALGMAAIGVGVNR